MQILEDEEWKQVRMLKHFWKSLASKFEMIMSIEN